MLLIISEISTML